MYSEIIPSLQNKHNFTIVNCSIMSKALMHSTQCVCLSAPCAPEILNLTQVSSSAVQVLWRATNKQANYTVNAFGNSKTLTCSSTGTSCDITNLPCGTTYEVSMYATTIVGRSLPSYTIELETGRVLNLETR